MQTSGPNDRKLLKESEPGMKHAEQSPIIDYNRLQQGIRAKVSAKV